MLYAKSMVKIKVMYKMIGFDLDGTLADTIPMCIKAFRNSVSPYTGHILSDEEIVKTFGLNEIGMIKAVAGEHWKLALKDFYLEYSRIHGKEVKAPFSGVSELLQKLKEHNIILALITGKGEKSGQISLEQLSLTQYFDEILYGSEKAQNKSEHMEYLINKYQLDKKDFCYVGDTVGDIGACRKVGVTCLSAAWQRISPVEELKKINSPYVFSDVKELENYLFQM